MPQRGADNAIKGCPCVHYPSLYSSRWEGWINKRQETLMPFTLPQLWQRDVHPCCPHHGAPLQRLSAEIPRQESERRGGWNRFKELWWERLAMKEALVAQKASPLLFFGSLTPLSLQDLSNKRCWCHTSVLSYEPKLVLHQISCITLHACLFLSSFLWLFFFSPPNIVRRRQTSFSNRFADIEANIQGCERW